MAIKRKTCDIRTWKETFVSRHILHQHWYTCSSALQVRRDPQDKSILTVVSAISASQFQLFRHQRNVCHQVMKSFTRQTLKEKHSFMNIFWNVPLRPQETHNRRLFFGDILLEARSPFWLLKQASEHAYMRLVPIPFLLWKIIVNTKMA
jgi:hypothetical protein